MRRVQLALALALAGTLAATPAPAVTTASENDAALDECAQSIERDPGSLEKWSCLSEVDVRVHRNAAALRLLDAIETGLKDGLARALAHLTRARLLQETDPARGEELYREAIDRFAALGHTEGEAAARAYLVDALFFAQRWDDALEESEHALPVAERGAAHPMLALLHFNRARIFMVRGEDVRAYIESLAIREVEGFDAMNPRFRAFTLHNIAHFAQTLELHEVALDAARASLALAEETGQEEPASGARIKIAEILEIQAEDGRVPRDVAIEAARRAVDGAYDAVHQREAVATLGRLLPGREGLAVLEALDRRFPRDDDLWTTKAIGEKRMEVGGDQLPRAIEDLRRAAGLARESLQPRDLALVLPTLADALLRAGRRGEALDAAQEMVLAIESVRGQPGSDTWRARAAEGPIRVATHLLGQILDADDAGDEHSFVFGLHERLRAIGLRRALFAAEIETCAAEAEDTRLAQTARELSRVQLELLRSDLDAQRRDELTRRLARLERDDEARRAQLAAEGSHATLDARAGLATIGAVQRELDEQSAMVSFMAPAQVFGPLRAFVVTSHDAHALRLGRWDAIDSAVAFWRGALTRGDALEAQGAARLHRELLGRILERLPQGVTRLVVVPDASLHGLPFDALRPDAASLPLAWTHEVSIAPSASVWLALRERGAAAPEARALVLADPAPAWSSESVSRWRSAFERGVALGRLPGARREGRRALERLGGAGELLLDDDASEARLKREHLSARALLHLAAHAVVDETRPQRSAILLAPGADDEDGLLQPREIAALAGAPRIVTLATCESARGATIVGEGLAGLVPAFLRAGSSSIVASLWPIGDEETALLMDTFYAELGAGRPAGQALVRAKRAAIEEGLPARAWAGLTLIGDASVAPWQGATANEGSRTSRRLAVFVLLLAALGVAGLFGALSLLARR